MMSFLIAIHLVICIALIFIVLLQTGKGGLDSNFGGIATNALGTQGANQVVKRWTAILFSVFVISCVILANMVNRGGNLGGRVVRGAAARAQQEAQRAIPAETPFEMIEFESAEPGFEGIQLQILDPEATDSEGVIRLGIE